MPVNLRALLEEMIEKDASDLHIVAGERPKIRVDGDIVNSSVDEVLTPKDTLSLAYSVLTENQKKRFETENELDFSFGIQNLARFRGNVFKQRGCVSMVIRQIPFSVKTFDDLGLPDVVLVGEMRDLETTSSALTIAETGHLAFATLHTNSAAESINRIIDIFPAHQQTQIRTQLSFVLEGVITQTLLQKAKGKGRVMAAEILICTPAIRALIRDDKVEQIPSMMQAGKKHGMQTLNDALYQLYMGREVSKEECLRVTSQPNDFLRMLGEAPLDDREPLPTSGAPAGAPKVAARR